MEYKCLHQYVEDVAGTMAGKIAVAECGVSITYGALNERANRIGHLLCRLTTDGNPVIATLLPGSIDLVSSLLGIFKCGGIYLPLDKGFSSSRMKQVFEQSAPAVLITHGPLKDSVIQLINELQLPVQHIIVLDATGGIELLDNTGNLVTRIAEEELPADNLDKVVDADGGNYIIYTSGSTGMGKAILGSHKGLSHFIHWEIQEFGIAADCRVSQLSQVTFDASLRDVFVPLCSGGTLYIPGADIKNNTALLLNWIEEKEITLIHCVPSIFRLMIRELEQMPAIENRLPQLQYILMAGESIYAKDIHDWRRQVGEQVELVNLYGTSETTLAKTFHRVKEVPENGSQVIHVGKPISNAMVVIVNAEHICKVGEIGEIYIKTPFWSKGYYKNKILTAQVFVQNPLVSDRVDLVYKTGDMGRYLPDRSIEVLGRVDDQVKVNGIRVTLGEVEQAMLKVAGIEEVVVAAHRNKNGDTELIGYYKGDITDTDVLREQLKPELNESLIPAWFVRMESFPLSLNGKVDKKSLPKPEQLVMEHIEYEAVSNELEVKLEKIWKEVLGRERIGRKAAFFKIGGTSLKAIQVISRIFRELDVSLIIADLFSHQTIGELASLVQATVKNTYEAIPTVAWQPHYALTHAQKRIWIINQLEGEQQRSAYNIFGSYIFEGRLNRVALQRAFEYVIDRHESLRTVFIEVSGEPYQKVCSREELGYVLEFEDLRQSAEPEEEAQLQSHGEASRGFDLLRGPLIRTRLLQVAEERHVFLFTLHHIISDGWSMEVLFRELLHCYDQYVKGIQPALKPIRIQYKDYAAWQNGLLQQEDIAGHRQYWLQQLSGELPVLELPADYQRPEVRENKGAAARILLNKETRQGIHTLAQSSGASVFMVLLSAVKLLLYRYSGQQELIVGIPVAGRDHIDLEDQVGFYINTLALRSRFMANQRVEEFLQEVKHLVLNAYTHQLYPFDKLVEELEVPRDMSRTAVFDVMVSMQAEVSAAEETADLQDVDAGSYETATGISKFDLVFYFRESEEDILLQVEYNTSLFKPERIGRMLGHFQRLAEAMAQDSAQSIGSINYLPEAEVQQLLQTFNQTTANHLNINSTVINIFEQQVEKYADHIALVNGERRLTYKELNEYSNRLGWWLRKRYNIQPDDVIGIIADRSEWMLISILGILKSGAGYVPIDPSYPTDRQLYMLSDSGAVCVLIDGSAPGLNYENIILLPELWQQELQNESPLNVPHTVAANHACYIIYTSGSTGRPKGVVVEQGSVVNLVKGSNYADIGPQHRVLQLSNYVFDGSIFDIFGALLNGAQLCMVDRETLLSAEKLSEYITVHGVNMMLITTAMFNNFIELNAECIGLFEKIYFGGEKASVPHIRRALQYRRHPDSIVNLYGPTEGTSFCTYHIVRELPEDASTVPIGSPVTNAKLYILDSQLQLQAVGVDGEICIGGVSVARGYLHGEEAGKERFISNPYAAGERLYRTGDIGRWREDGTIEYVGRKDTQIKLRGHRIELSEIEMVLNNCPGIEQAIVVAGGSGTDKYITGYYRCGTEGVDESVLRNYLLEKLPGYMVPSYLVSVEAFRLTATGKIDRKALPDPFLEGTEQRETYKAAGNETEALLVNIWEEVLGRRPVGIRDNFFALGGDSIKAIQVSARLYRKGLQLKIKDLFSLPDIERLAQVIQPSNQRVADQSIVTGEVELTPVQHLFFKSHQQELQYFNQSILLYAREGYAVEGIRKVMQKLLEHHDALRMTYADVTGNVRQVNNGTELQVDVQEYDLRYFEQGKEEMYRLANAIQAGINIETGSLVQAAIFKLADGDRLLIVIHHLVIDGVSWRILFEDIGSLYRQYLSDAALVLPPKTDSFRLWSRRLTEYANSEVFLKEKAYWHALENTTVTPLAQRHGDVLVKDSDTVAFVLTRDETELLLTRVNHAYGTEINDILLAGLSMSIAEVFGHTNVLIGMEGHGREPVLEDIDVSRTVGWFTSVYPVLLNADYANNISRQLIEVKETLRNIPAKGIGYGIVKYLTQPEYKKELQFSLQPQISFNYLGQFDTDVSNAGLEIAMESSGEGQSALASRDYLLDVSGVISGNQLILSITYDTTHLPEEKITSLKDSYHRQLQQIIAHCTAREKRTLTPADLTYNNLSIDTLSVIATDETEDIYPLSPMQEGMLFHHLYDPSSEAYFLQFSYRLQGTLDISCVQKSLQELSRRYDILRTAFIHKNLERPLQTVLKNREIEFNFHDISSINDSEERELLVQAIKEKDKQRLFDLSNDALMRVNIVQLTTEEYEFTWSYHHILMDGWCMAILTREYYELYTSYITQRKPLLPAASPYKHYIRWLMQQGQDAAEAFWTLYLADYAQLSGIPRRVVAGNQQQKPVYAQKVFSIDKEKMALLSALASRSQATVNTLVQALWGIILANYNNTTDVVFGAVVSGRPADVAGAEEMVGLFINTIPVRIRYTDQLTFNQLLPDLQQQALDAAHYHYTPLATIQSGSELKQQLFDHIMVFENYPVTEQIASNANRSMTDAPDTEVMAVHSFEHTHYDFTIIVNPRNELQFTLDYNSEVCDEEFINRIPGYFYQLIDQVLRNSDTAVTALSLVSAADQLQLLQTFNNTHSTYPENKTLVHLFEEQVARTPGNIAVVFENRKLTYRELNERSNQLGRWLRRHYVIKPGDLIGIMMERSEWMIIGIWGILKSGAAYVPIDPAYPNDRKQFMITDAALSCVLVDEEDVPRSRETVLLNIKQVWETDICKEQPDNPEAVANAGDIAYVIYTSGSTGVPKGCVLEHSGVVNRIDWMQQQYGCTESDHVLQKTPVIFDVSVWEIFMTTCYGGRLVVCSREVAYSPAALIEHIAAHQISIIHFVPSLFEAFTDAVNNDNIRQLVSLRHIITSGEALSAETVRRHYKKMQVPLHNLYGPTEASVDVSHYTTTKNDNVIPIGKPINNIKLYILNDQLQLVPPGVEGEIFISGIGLAREYLNREQLTKEKFLVNPFEQGERLYRTGDRGRWLPDGNIEYLGRKDEQVKIRGYRIEPGEIENQLTAYEGVISAVVQVRGEGADKYLAAYYSSNNKTGEQDILTWLKEKLPAYMIPAYVVRVDEFPLTASGKVDRRKLPDPVSMDMGHPGLYEGARNAMEEQLIEAWQEVLGRERVGIRDDFFKLGGHSIKAIRLAGLVAKTLNRQIELKEIFQHPTVAQLAAMLQQKETTSFTSIPVIPVQSHYALTHAQKRLWVMNQLEQDQGIYNICTGIKLLGQLEQQALRRAFNSIIDRHESLRTSIVLIEGEPRQLVQAVGEYQFNVEYEDLRTMQDKLSLARQLAAEEAATAFQLDKGPLLRCRLLQLEDEQAIFLLTMHHIIADGWSMDIFFREIVMLYEMHKQGAENTLSSLRIQYKDYAHWEALQLSGEKLEYHRQYWMNQFRDGIPVTELPTDFYRAAQQSFRGNKLRFLLQETVTAKINARLEKSSATPFMFLLAVVNVVLYKYTGQCDIVTGTAVNGRNHPDLDDQIGLFVNLLPVRLRFETGTSFNTLLELAKEVTLNGYAHDVYPFDVLVNDLGIERSPNRFPLFDVLVQMQESPAVQQSKTAAVFTSVDARGFEFDVNGAKFDLTFSFHHAVDIIEVTIEYNMDLFQASTIARIESDILDIVRLVADDGEITVHELKKQLVHKAKTQPGNYAFINENLQEDF